MYIFNRFLFSTRVSVFTCSLKDIMWWSRVVKLAMATITMIHFNFSESMYIFFCDILVFKDCRRITLKFTWFNHLHLRSLSEIFPDDKEKKKKGK